MKITILPKTFLGKISTAMYVVFISLMILEGRIFSASRSTDIIQNPFENPLHATILFVMFTVIILAAIIGYISILKNEERSIIIFLMIPMGVFHLIGVVFLIFSYLG